MFYFQQFCEAYVKANIKICGTGPFLGESSGRRWIPLTKGQ